MKHSENSVYLGGKKFTIPVVPHLESCSKKNLHFSRGGLSLRVKSYSFKDQGQKLGMAIVPEGLGQQGLA